MKFWREASTLILALSPRSATVSVAGQQYQKSIEACKTGFKILMLRRSHRTSFMPSKVVFPGGGVHEADYSKYWQDLYKQVMGYSLDDVSHHLGSKNSSTPLVVEQRDWPVVADIAFRICALRETFEESGILLLTNEERLKSDMKHKLPYRSSDQLLAIDVSWRKKIEKDPFEFLALCRELHSVPDVWSVKPWRNWLTPAFQRLENAPSKKPRRFDTMFYLSCIECDDVPAAIADESESIRAEWKCADEYIHACSTQGSSYGSLAPPQAYELNRLSQCKNLEELNAECERGIINGINRWMPVFRTCKDALISVLPGDFLYPSDPDFYGTRDLPLPMPCSLSDLTDPSKSMNRITFAKFEDSSAIDTTIANSADVDILLQSGIITHNIDSFV